MVKDKILSPLELYKQREKDKRELKEYQVKTELDKRFLYGRSKEKFPQGAAKANLKQVQRIQLPPKLISQEQYMLMQLFGHGDNAIFNDGNMLPISSDGKGEGRGTWEMFGL